jgi:UDP-glucose 4-epimerase
MRVVVTGGSGFIGSHVLDALAKEGHEPVVFDLVATRHQPPGTYRTITGDVTDRETTRRAVRRCDAVIHLAAIADVNDVVANPVHAGRVNVLGTHVVLEAARREEVSRVVYGSTVWVYGGASAAEEVTEDTPLAAPTHLYTATKLAGELYTLGYNAMYGAEHTVLRLGIPYGPRSRPATVVPSFVLRAQQGHALRIAGDGRQARQFVYAEDLAAGIVAGLAPSAAGRTYNLVGEEETSVREIADIVRRLVAPVPIVHGPERPADVHLGRVSGARAAAELGWRPTISFGQGLRRYIDWLAVTSGTCKAATEASTNGRAAAVRRQEPAEL